VKCPKGVHPYPESRTVRPDRGTYYCRDCHNDRQRKGRYQPDDVSVERAVAGDPPDYIHPEERRRIVLECRSMTPRVSLRETARRARCSVTQVCRIQKAGRGDVW
jgi:hypothetical protein